ncbi:glutathione S-transferase family protein [Salinisphaera sp. Q1T1-3]|nr:glutathione S-transferase family protein [Salinisphaera sp. Q1T1-3]
MKLYGTPLSPFVRKVWFMIAELGLECESIEIAPRSQDTEFRATSPLGRIPSFVDGDFVTDDSGAICRYLAMRERSALMGGPSPQRQARVVRWERWVDDDLNPALLTPLLERIVKPLRTGAPPDDAALEAGLAALPDVYAHLEGELTGRAPWLLGETFSHADYRGRRGARYRPDRRCTPRNRNTADVACLVGSSAATTGLSDDAKTRRRPHRAPDKRLSAAARTSAGTTRAYIRSACVAPVGSSGKTRRRARCRDVTQASGNAGLQNNDRRPVGLRPKTGHAGLHGLTLDEQGQVHAPCLAGFGAVTRPCATARAPRPAAVKPLKIKEPLIYSSTVAPVSFARV